MLERASPDGRFRATVINIRQFTDYETFVRVHDDGMDQGENVKTLLRRYEGPDDITVHWEDAHTLVVQYPYRDDHRSKYVILKEDTSWHGLRFILRPMPTYSIVVENRRAERVRYSPREGSLVGGCPGCWMEPCSMDEHLWLTYEARARSIDNVYANEEGKIVFFARLQPEIVDETMLVRDQEGKVVLTTPLKAPILRKDIGEVRWVIPGEAGKECP